MKKKSQGRGTRGEWRGARKQTRSLVPKLCLGTHVRETLFRAYWRGIWPQSTIPRLRFGLVFGDPALGDSPRVPSSTPHVVHIFGCMCCGIEMVKGGGWWVAGKGLHGSALW